MMPKFEKYKSTGFVWMGDIPEHWEIKRIKQIVLTKVTDGPHTTPDFIDDGVPFISAEAIKDNEINFEKRRGFITKELDEEYSKKVKPQRNDIFIVKSGATTGRVACVETDLNFNIWSPLAMVRCAPKRTYYRYLFYQLQSLVFKTQIEIGWSFGTQENIGMGIIECLYISLPNTQEQLSIANYLDDKTAKLDKLIKNKKEQIEKLKEIRQNEINNAVTKGLNPKAKMKPSGIEWLGDIPEHWVSRRLKDKVKVNTTSLGADTEPDYILQYLDISNVDSSGVTGEIQELAFVEAPSRARRIIVNEDVIMSTVRPYLKAIAYMNNMPGNLIASTGFAVMSCKNGFQSKYLYYLTISHWFNCTINSEAVGASYPAVNNDVLTATKIICPPIEEQKLIIEYLDVKVSGLDKLITRTERQTEQLQEIRKIEIYNAVTGKIKVV